MAEASSDRLPDEQPCNVGFFELMRLIQKVEGEFPPDVSWVKVVSMVAMIGDEQFFKEVVRNAKFKSEDEKYEVVDAAGKVSFGWMMDVLDMLKIENVSYKKVEQSIQSAWSTRSTEEKKQYFCSANVLSSLSVNYPTAYSHVLKLCGDPETLMPGGKNIAKGSEFVNQLYEAFVDGQSAIQCKDDIK